MGEGPGKDLVTGEVSVINDCKWNSCMRCSLSHKEAILSGQVVRKSYPKQMLG